MISLPDPRPGKDPKWHGCHPRARGSQDEIDRGSGSIDARSSWATLPVLPGARRLGGHSARTDRPRLTRDSTRWWIERWEDDAGRGRQLARDGRDAATRPPPHAAPAPAIHHVRAGQGRSGALNPALGRPADERPGRSMPLFHPKEHGYTAARFADPALPFRDHPDPVFAHALQRASGARGGCPWLLLSANSQMNPLENASLQLDEAAARLGLPEGVKDMLKRPRRTTIQHLPVLMDDGSIQVFTGYRCQHSIARGPAKGGSCLSPGREHPRGRGAGVVDDLEVRRGRHSLPQRQGRHRRGPAQAVARRAGAPDAPLRRRPVRSVRARVRRARSRREHR